MHLGAEDNLPLVTDQVTLGHVETGQFQRAAVFEGLGDKQLEAIQQEWETRLWEERERIRKDCRYAQVSEDTFLEKLGASQLQDAHWDWGLLLAESEDDPGRIIFTLECERQVQGIIYLTHPRPCQHESHSGERLAYVEFLAVAPWNRKPLNNGNKRYRAAGSTLLAIAVNASDQLGYNGRIGLHSLPQACPFYRNGLGMSDFGFDPAKEMNYFEFSTAEAASFLRSVMGNE